MKKHYLDFEKPLKDFDDEIQNLVSIDSESEKLDRLKNMRIEKEKEIFSNLNPWQTVQLARHPNRPYTLDYISAWCDDFIELHGDKAFSDDKAVVAGIGTIDTHRVVIIGQQKGRNTKENLYRNFGMMKPEGYRKALRIMKMAEKFDLPVITLIDTPGADPGVAAEERGQGYAIANNLIEMASIETPILSIVIGEGASGGALGIGLCDRFLMMQNTWYSVISPEGCASILFRDASKAEEAAEALKVTPDDMIEMGICDKIIAEPNGGAHRDMDSSAKNLELAILDAINELKSVEGESFIDLRIEKYDKLGVFETFK